MIKKIKTLSIIAISLSLLPIMSVQAASGSISVSASSRSLSVGNTTSVTVKCTSTSAIGTCEYSMNYDSSKLKMTSGEYSVAEAGNGSGKTITKYYKFKAIASGSSTISVKSYAIRDFKSGNEISTAVYGTKITSAINGNKNPSSSSSNKELSNNNYLKSLSISGQKISPTFNKNTLNYTVALDEKIEKITINAIKEDTSATVYGAGEVKVSEGENKINIVVTSEKNTKRTYTITATVKDPNPIATKVDGIDYTVVKKDSLLPDLETYKKTEIKIDNIKVPALYSEITKLNLVGLKNQEGVISLFIYNEDDNSYMPYNELKFDGLRFYPIETDKKLDNYIESEVMINDIKIKCFKINKNSKYSIVYGMNVETGEEGFYTYEKSENTLQKYSSEIENKYQDELKKQKQFIIILGSVIIFLCILLIIVAAIKTKKKNKKENNIKLEKDIKNTEKTKKQKTSPVKELDKW